MKGVWPALSAGTHDAHKMVRKIIFDILCWIILLVGAIDTYWLSKNRDSIMEFEKNPVGRYLISLDDGDVSLFILCKFIGTFTVIYFLQKLFVKKKDSALAIALALALFQIFLLAYLYCGVVAGII